MASYLVFSQLGKSTVVYHDTFSTRAEAETYTGIESTQILDTPIRTRWLIIESQWPEKVCSKIIQEAVDRFDADQIRNLRFDTPDCLAFDLLPGDIFPTITSEQVRGLRFSAWAIIGQDEEGEARPELFVKIQG